MLVYGKETEDFFCNELSIDYEDALLDCEKYVDKAHKKNEGKNYLLYQIQKFIDNVHNRI